MAARAGGDRPSTWIDTEWSTISDGTVNKLPTMRLLARHFRMARDPEQMRHNLFTTGAFPVNLASV